jgi:hypothetical protein
MGCQWCRGACEHQGPHPNDIHYHTALGSDKWLTDDERSRYRVGKGPSYQEPVDDPHLIVFSDGCGSWYGRNSRQLCVDFLQSDYVGEVFDGARIVPVRRVGDGSGMEVVDRETGVGFGDYQKCGAHEGEQVEARRRNARRKAGEEAA